MKTFNCDYLSDAAIDAGSENGAPLLLAFELEEGITREKLKAGFQRALQAYPKASCVYQGQNWIPQEKPFDIVEERADSLNEGMTRFIREGFDLSKEPGVKQKILLTEGKRWLLFKFSHVLCDGIGGLIFLEAQLLGVKRNPRLKLKSYGPKKDTPYKKFFPSGKLGSPGTGKTLDVLFFVLPKKGNLRLVEAMLDALEDEGVANPGIWHPINLREKPNEGFGNGISRARIYKTPLAGVKRQLARAFVNGEVFSPPPRRTLSGLEKLVLKAWLNRPFIDYGTLLLSHVDEERLGLDALKKFSGIRGIIPPHKKHAASLYVHTTDRHYCSLSYYSEELSGNRARSLVASFERRFHE